MKQEEFLSFARRMRAAGISLYIEEDDHGKCPQAPAEGLLIRQIDGVTESSAFDIPPCGTGYRIDVRITSNLTGVFAIADFGLELPWKDLVNWLPDPRECAADPSAYCFPGMRSLQYSRTVVINHYADVTRTMSKGQSINGLLLGFGGPMPDTVRHGEMIPAILSVFGQFDRKFSYSISLWADRSQKLFPESRKKAPTRNILDHPDPGYGHSVDRKDKA
jgi:hypothetical protein